MSPTGTIFQPLAHSYDSPPFAEAKVHDAMRVGVITCTPDTPLREVARMMATYRVHSVVVSELGLGGERPWGVVSDLDVAVAAGNELAEHTARDVARTELVTVYSDDSLRRASQLMSEHEVSHLVVIQPRTKHPVGVLSTLDIANAVAFDRSS